MKPADERSHRPSELIARIVLANLAALVLALIAGSLSAAKAAPPPFVTPTEVGVQLWSAPYQAGSEAFAGMTVTLVVLISSP
jgi:hypothetical protein